MKVARNFQYFNFFQFFQLAKSNDAKQELVEMECKGWASKGMNINYEVRDNRRGYKAGALKEGMKYGYVQECEYFAIFDSDFQPQSDFLISHPKGFWQFVQP